MTETLTNRQEQIPNSQTLLLRRGLVGTDPGGRKLIDKETVISTHGINGDVLALITLPSDSTKDPSKTLALVDFGDYKDTPPNIFSKEHIADALNRPVKGRFGLVAYNYAPDDVLVGYAPLEPGLNTFGRSGNWLNHSLGLDKDTPDNDLVSRIHFSVRLGEPDRNIHITDLSTNGTAVTIPDYLPKPT